MSRLNNEYTMTAPLHKQAEGVYVFGLVALNHLPEVVAFEQAQVQYLPFTKKYHIAYCHTISSMQKLWQLTTISSPTDQEMARYLVSQHHYVNLQLMNPHCFLSFRYGTIFHSLTHLKNYLENRSAELLKKCEQVQGLQEFCIQIKAKAEQDIKPTSSQSGHDFFMQKYERFKQQHQQEVHLDQLNQMLTKWPSVAYIHTSQTSIFVAIKSELIQQFKACLTAIPDQWNVDSNLEVSGPWPVHQSLEET